MMTISTTSQQPAARYLVGDRHFKQAVGFPVSAESAPYAWLASNGKPVHLLIEHARGQLVIARIELISGAMIKPVDVARYLSMVHPDLLRNASLYGEAARQFKENWPIEISFLDIDVNDPNNSLKDLIAKIDGLHLLLQKFFSQLPTPTCKVLQVSRLPFLPSVYNRISAHNHAGHPALAQAVTAYPFLGKDLLLNRDDGPNTQILNWIERCVPLRPRLAEQFKVPEETIRWLAQQEPRNIGIYRQQETASLLINLAAIPPEWRPKSVNEWRLFNAACEYTQLFMLRPLQIHWLRFLGKFGWLPSFLYLRERRLAFEQLAGVNDYLFELQIISNILWRWQPDLAARHQGLLELVKKLSPFVLLSASTRWHQLVQQTPAGALQELPPSTTWPAPLDVIDLGERVAYFLNNESALEEEGSTMLHCVGTYGGRCHYGDTQIVSLRTHNNKHTATASLVLRNQGEKWWYALDELRSCGNTPPEKADVNACQALLAELNKAENQSTLIAIHEGAELRRAQIKIDKAAQETERQIIMMRTLPAVLRKYLESQGGHRA